jgi:formylglycine-generating enzyme required for sulfatase activity
MIAISSGTYRVGLDPEDAEFFDQTPRHPVSVSGFSIDRRLVGPPQTGRTFTQARDSCAKLSMRLPSEEQWEIAAQVDDFVLEPGLFEWTASWYQAYPGNTRDEDAYGARFRVLRGVGSEPSDTVHRRRFMDPNQSSSRVGFRCVRDEN